VAGISVIPSFARIFNKNKAEAEQLVLPPLLVDNYSNEFKLGLDLQGGLHLEYSVAVDSAIENKLDQIAAEVEGNFKEKKDITATVERISLTELHIKLPTPEDIDLATDDVMGITFGSMERLTDAPGEPGASDGVIRLQMPDQVVSETRKAIVGQALDTVRRRVDAMGVAEPNIYPKNRQIVVELPGLSDTATELRAAQVDAATQLSEILRGTGVEQVITVEVKEDPGAFRVTIPDQDASKLLRDTFGDKVTDQGVIVDERLGAELQIVPPDAGAEPDPATTVLSMTQLSRDTILEESSDFRRLLRVIERAAVLEMHLVDDEAMFAETGKPYLRALFEAGFVQEGMGIAVNMEPDYGRPEKGGVTVKEPFVYYAQERETLRRFFNNLPAKWRLPATHSVAYGQVPIVTQRGAEPEYLWRTHIIKSRSDLTGERIVNATVGFKADTGVPQVNVTFDRIGADAFENMSGENVGRKMAIVMDENVVSDPIFNERIGGGSVVITLGNSPGESVREQANDLVKVLKSGSLPARLHKEFEIRVGADLGADSVDRGFKAFLLGLLLVIIFMAIYYRRAGLVAVFALVMNMILVLAAMAFFKATLTLPGIAGIVLTIGMAVDANVIIFERVREYVREGYTARAAIEAGYDRAFTTILDSQLTTAIAGVVLWQYGSGPIRGFAITLLIGIATSIFTGVFATRVFFDWQANRRGFDRVSI
jgi:protein-export membrane protein SecD